MSRRTPAGGASFWQFARDYLHDYCPKVRHMSPTTIQAYRIGLECFITYLAQEGTKRSQITFDHFDRQTIRSYSTWMTRTKAYSPKTVDLRLTVLKSFLKYVAWQDPALMALHDAAVTIRPPKQPKRPVEHLCPDATTAILAAYNGATPKTRRNRMLLVLLYDSAARVSEIADAAVGDLHLDKPSFITLTGKGGKTRHMPLMNATVEHLKVYLDEFHPTRAANNDPTPLFNSQKQGRPSALSTDSVAAILKQAAAHAASSCTDIPDRVHCHLIRKTRAMDLYNDGVPLPLIMQMLGHESMSTTSSFYAFATMKMMTDAIEAANPHAVGQRPDWKRQSIIDTLYSL